MNTWSFPFAELSRGVLRYAVERGARPVAVADVLGAWQADAAFRAAFDATLAAAPFAAFRWETPAVTNDTLSRAFEFVLLDDPGLAREPDPEAFADHFRAAAGAPV